MTSTIVVDAMGGDHFPDMVVESSLSICRENDNINIILTGDEGLIKSSIDKSGECPGNLEIVHAPDVISMHDSPSAVIRQKKGSSIHIGLNLLKEGRGDAFFSAGNSGAIMALSYFILGLLKNISRPASAINYPAYNGREIVFLDLGATMDAKATHLRDFALMGSALSTFITGNESPLVSLLNIGEESAKGKSAVIKAAKAIQSSAVNYGGFIESDKMFFSPEVDVIVADGFTGNITLKTVEGLSEAIFGIIKNKLPGNFLNKFFKSTFSRFDYSLYGSALLLGVNSLVGIGHGKSSKKALKTGILTLAEQCENNFMHVFKENIIKLSR